MRPRARISFTLRLFANVAASAAATSAVTLSTHTRECVELACVCWLTLFLGGFRFNIMSLRAQRAHVFVVASRVITVSATATARNTLWVMRMCWPHIVVLIIQYNYDDTMAQPESKTRPL